MPITEWPIKTLLFKLDGLLHLGIALVKVEFLVRWWIFDILF